jgi:hypothetical protein
MAVLCITHRHKGVAEMSKKRPFPVEEEDTPQTLARKAIDRIANEQLPIHLLLWKGSDIDDWHVVLDLAHTSQEAAETAERMWKTGEFHCIYHVDGKMSSRWGPLDAGGLFNHGLPHHTDKGVVDEQE